MGRFCFGKFCLKKLEVCIGEKKIFPLGGRGNTYFLMDNEAGFYPLYLSDRFGFNNSDDVYNKKIKVMITGDHIAEGLSVNYKQTIGFLLNQSGCNTLNVGRYDNAALAKYASLVEYGKIYKPEVVLWLHYPDDVHELKRELQIPLLLNYLKNDDYFQNLVGEQENFDKAILPYLEKARQDLKRKRGYFSKRRILTLKNVRDLFYINNSSDKKNYISLDKSIKNELKSFEKILFLSSRLIDSWGGKKYFFYFPEYRIYQGNTNYNFRGVSINELKTRVKKIAQKYNFKIIDTQEIIFENYRDPEIMFPMLLDSHYSANGYEKIFFEIRKLFKEEKINC